MALLQPCRVQSTQLSSLPVKEGQLIFSIDDKKIYIDTDSRIDMTPEFSASLSSLGITATAEELNYMDGVTSNVQEQLNGKAASSHNHSAANITSGTLAVARGGTGATTAAKARSNLGAAASDIVVVQSSQPSSSTCKLWIKP